jgi:hypothetical protein
MYCSSTAIWLWLDMLMPATSIMSKKNQDTPNEI